MEQTYYSAVNVIQVKPTLLSMLLYVQDIQGIEIEFPFYLQRKQQ